MRISPLIRWPNLLCHYRLAERGYAGLADNRDRLAEVVTRKLQDSFYINVSWDALNTAYSEHPEWFSGLVSGDEN
ncbi:hypothetical protein CE48_004816 [Escherichia coli]|nr:hypothetical protein [Escherichia coli]